MGIVKQLVTGDSRVAPAFELRRREENDKLDRLRVEYRAALTPALVGVLLVNATPAKTRRFVEVAKSELPVIVVDGDGLYTAVAADVERTLGRAPTAAAPLDYGGLQLRETFASLRRACDPLGLRFSVDQPQHLTALRSTQDIVRCVRGAIRAANSDKLNAAYLLAKIGDLALEQAIDDPVVAVIITGVEPDEVADLSAIFTQGHVVIDDLPSREKVTKELVMSKFEALKSAVQDNVKK